MGNTTPPGPTKPELNEVGSAHESSVPLSARTEPPVPAGGQSTMVMVVYILYLVGLASGLAALIGVVLAYQQQKAAAGTWMESHILFQIRTFWFGLAIIIVGFALAPVGIGIIILIFFVVWSAIRSTKGLAAYSRRAPVENPNGYFW